MTNVHKFTIRSANSVQTLQWYRQLLLQYQKSENIAELQTNILRVMKFQLMLIMIQTRLALHAFKKEKKENHIHRVLGFCEFLWCGFYSCTFSKKKTNILLMYGIYTTYCKVASSSISQLVTHFQILRRLMQGKFDAYVL